MLIIKTQQEFDEALAALPVAGGVPELYDIWMIVGDVEITVCLVVANSGRLTVKSGGRLNVDVCGRLVVDGGEIDVRNGGRLDVCGRLTVVDGGEIDVHNGGQITVDGNPIASGEVAEANLRAVAAAALATENSLEMSCVHECETTHCLAGWACVLLPGGRELEHRHNWYTAGLALLGVDVARRFYDGTDRMREWLRSKVGAGQPEE